MSVIIEKCDHCGIEGRLGPHSEIGAFRFLTPNGSEVIRYLHRNDGERRCYHEYEAKYKAWMEKQRARKAANG